MIPTSVPRLPNPPSYTPPPPPGPRLWEAPGGVPWQGGVSGRCHGWEGLGLWDVLVRVWCICVPSAWSVTPSVRVVLTRGDGDSDWVLGGAPVR